ncbi:hypothetical protein H7J77_12640 [Mycolicibacillus parakoreensis]|uniref:Uncharacterized protein n=1 Tax=Mycolicibacillus parakoreensis TaxID=1069221 RepID=A0ABY3TY22_9MYCO|nr:hypothetical protein [Mycolicibacillus parakoreensis]MCV7316383.1 hypothetical protein [Mycolicibacillus parakoreensis]ULN52623.1 hypothetical protein MIU77_17615 [Mycolicibacillus parakoreensis]
MSRPTEFLELYDLVGGLQRCLATIRGRYTDVPGMQRIIADVDRIVADVELLDADADALDLSRWTNPAPSEQKVVIPDTEYDYEFWRDVDDEGVGGSRF